MAEIGLPQEDNYSVAELLRLIQYNWREYDNGSESAISPEESLQNSIIASILSIGGAASAVLRTIPRSHWRPLHSSNLGLDRGERNTANEDLSRTDAFNENGFFDLSAFQPSDAVRSSDGPQQCDFEMMEPIPPLPEVRTGVFPVSHADTAEVSIPDVDDMDMTGEHSFQADAPPFTGRGRLPFTSTYTGIDIHLRGNSEERESSPSSSEYRPASLADLAPFTGNPDGESPQIHVSDPLDQNFDFNTPLLPHTSFGNDSPYGFATSEAPIQFPERSDDHLVSLEGTGRTSSSDSSPITDADFDMFDNASPGHNPATASGGANHSRIFEHGPLEQVPNFAELIDRDAQDVHGTYSPSSSMCAAPSHEQSLLRILSRLASGSPSPCASPSPSESTSFSARQSPSANPPASPSASVCEMSLPGSPACSDTTEDSPPASITADSPHRGADGDVLAENARPRLIIRIRRLRRSIRLRNRREGHE